MKEKREIGIPEFKSLEEEREYWEARGPLAEGHKGRLVKPKPGQKRSSFLAVRLTGEELTRLRDVAAKQGLGPSTYARIVLTSTIEQQNKSPKKITLDELKYKLSEKLPQAVKEKPEEFTSAVATEDPDKPSLNESDLMERLDKLIHEVVQLKSILINKEQPRKPKANGAWRDLMKASKEVSTLWTGCSAIEEIKSQREL